MFLIHNVPKYTMFLINVPKYTMFLINVPKYTMFLTKSNYTMTSTNYNDNYAKQNCNLRNHERNYKI